MPFLEQQIDARITRGVTFTETIPGRVIGRLPNGRVRQNFTATRQITKCDLSHGVRTAADYQSVLDAFLVVMLGGYTGLRVKNWRDYIATQVNTTATFLTGSTTELQLQRLHSFGGQTVKRDILKPRASPDVTVYRTRGGSTSAITASVSTTTGVATISGHVNGDTYTWTGEFDVPMFFVEPEWGCTLEVSTANLHVISGNVLMEELIEP